MSWAGLDVSILGPAFVAGMLVVSTHVPLGQVVLARGIIFIDLAVAQVAGLGVIIAYSLDWGHHGWAVQLFAVSAALLAAALLNVTERLWPEIQEALIGAMFVLAATASILFLAGNPHAGEYLKELLVGQILWVQYQSLIPVALLYALVLAVWFGLRRQMGTIGFYGLFAITVTASVQLVGVYLVFATLIIPALATLGWRGGPRLRRGYALGAAGYGAGLVASALSDLPSGAIIVWTLAGLGAVLAAIGGFRRPTTA